MAFGNGRGSGASDVAHAWAHQTGKTKSKGNVFYEGKVIYSYGRHFPMAVLIDEQTVAINAATYSNSTSTHQSKMRGAVSHMNMIRCYELPTSSDGKFESYHHSRNIDSWIKKVKDKLTEIAGKRQQRTKDRLMGELHSIQTEATKYIEYFKLKLKAAEKKQLFSVDFSGFIEGVRREQEAAKKKRAELLKKGKELHPVWLEAWRNGTEWDFNRRHPWDVQQQVQLVERDNDNYNNVRLRVFDGHVYTSKQVKIPVDIAHRYYRKYLAVVAKGGCSETCNYKMLEFEVKEMNADHLLVGCHDIARSEIDYIAEKLGWVKEKVTA